MSENHLSFKDISLTFDPIQLDKLRNFNIQMFEQISKLNNTYAIIDVSKQVEIISKVFAYRATESMRQSIDGISQTVALWNKTIALQAEKYLLITQSIETNMMESIKQSLINLDYSTYMKSLEKALSSFKIAAADIAYFKKIEVNNPDLNAILPRGFKTLLKDLNVSSANRLAKCEDVNLNSQTREFSPTHNPESTANASEMNVICAGASFFDELVGKDDIQESSLMDFMTFLERIPNFGIEHPIGRSIFEMLTDWPLQRRFDRDYYYHARARNEEAAPYTYQMMLQAPAGVSGPGRYNHPGRAHYYFSDTADGAKAEVSKHVSKGSALQVVKLAPNDEARLLDLSFTGAPGNAFLKYIRFPATEHSTMPREYYIPCFVADCCIRHNLDGIKYYGSKEYTNYVVWECRYFDYISME